LAFNFWLLTISFGLLAFGYWLLAFWLLSFDFYFWILLLALAIGCCHVFKKEFENPAP